MKLLDGLLDGETNGSVEAELTESRIFGVVHDFMIPGLRYPWPHIDIKKDQETLPHSRIKHVPSLAARANVRDDPRHTPHAGQHTPASRLFTYYTQNG